MKDVRIYKIFERELCVSTLLAARMLQNKLEIVFLAKRAFEFSIIYSGNAN